MNDNSGPNQNTNTNTNPGYRPNTTPGQTEDYTQLGGFLLVWYWCLMIFGVLLILASVIPTLVSLASLFFYGIVYFLGILLSLLASVVFAIFCIKAAGQLKARNPQFFDTYVTAQLVYLAVNIVANLLQISGPYGVGSFISVTIGSIIGLAIGLCLSIMYFSKSVRVGVYFGCRPLHYSRFWAWIKILPDFIISDSMPDPNNIPQMGSQPQPPPAQPHTPPPPASQYTAPQPQAAQPYAPPPPASQYTPPQSAQPHAQPQAPVPPQDTQPPQAP